MTKIYNKFGKFLREKRVAVGLSQKDIADEMGYSSSQFISNWERGCSSPPIEVLPKLAELYKVSADKLFDAHFSTATEIFTANLKSKYDDLKR